MTCSRPHLSFQLGPVPVDHVHGGDHDLVLRAAAACYTLAYNLPLPGDNPLYHPVNAGARRYLWAATQLDAGATASSCAACRRLASF